jgi:hypothetical protein
LYRCQHTCTSSRVHDALSFKHSEVLDNLVEHNRDWRQSATMCLSSFSYRHSIPVARHHGTSFSDLRKLRHFGDTTRTVNVILGTTHWGSDVLKGCKEGSILEKIEQIYSNNTGANTKSKVVTEIAENSPNVEIGDFWTTWCLKRSAQRRDEKHSELRNTLFKLQGQLLESDFARVIVKWKNGGNNCWTLHGMAFQQKPHTAEKWRCFAVKCIEHEDWPWNDNFSSHLETPHVVGHHAKAIYLGSRSSLVRAGDCIDTNGGRNSSTNEYAFVMGKAFKLLEHEATGKSSNETINKSASRPGRLNEPIISYTNCMMVVQGSHGNCAAMPVNTDERQEQAENNSMQSSSDDSKQPQPRPPMMSPDDDDDDETIGFQRAACSQPRMAPTTMPLQASHTYEHQKCAKCAHRIFTCCRSTLSRQNSVAEKHGFMAHEFASKYSKRILHGRWVSQHPSIVHLWRAVIAQTCGRVAFATTIDRIDRPETSIAVAG